MSWRFGLFVFSTSLFVMVIGCNGTSDEANKTEQRNRRDEAIKTSITVSPVKLLGEYKTDEAAADRKYKGKWLRLEGSVGNVEEAGTGAYYVTFRSDEGTPKSRVRCFFLPQLESSVVLLTRGKEITAIGKCTGKSGGNVLVKECEFVK